MKKSCQKAIIELCTIVAVLIVCSVPALAYPLSGTEAQSSWTSFRMSSFNFSWIGGVLNNLSAPFQGIINSAILSFNNNSSMNTIGKAVTNMSIGATGQRTAGDVFQNFDSWFYGVAGFHTSDFFNAVFGVIVWVLNLVKNAITWSLSFIH